MANSTNGIIRGNSKIAPLPFPELNLFKDSNQTITQFLSLNPKKSPEEARSKLFPKVFVLKRFYRRFFIKSNLIKGKIYSEDELNEAFKRGNFPSRPTDLFLKIYSDVLMCLTRDVLAGNVSPALLGSAGTIPLSIVAPIPDIMKHYHDCIILAETEIFLTTNYWQNSDSVNTISNSLIELNELISKRNGNKVIVKIMWDRGSFEQLYQNHSFVSPTTWMKLDLPSPDSIPNLSLEVINFHRPILGTFHQKALVVDRRIALLNSNNIQDRPNVEFMTHLEGPIVDSIYDCLLLSWNEKFNPPPPGLTQPSFYSYPPSSPNATTSNTTTTSSTTSSNETLNTPRHFPQTDSLYKFSDSNPYLAHIDIIKAAKASRNLLRLQNERELNGFNDNNGDGTEGVVKRSSPSRSGSWREDSKFAELVRGLTFNKLHLTNTHENSNEGVEVLKENKEVGIEKESKTEKDKNPSNYLQVTTDPQAGASLTTSPSSSSRLSAISNSLNAGAKTKANAAFDDESLIDAFKPHMIHKQHDLIPMALVNRKPHGMPGHQDLRVPQDAAWLAVLRYATKNVFIQTPTLNAKPIVRGIIEACKRGIKIELYLDLGFNDLGESIPFQNGTNEEVVVYLYKTLKEEKFRKNLFVYWYTAIDQLIPLNAVHKSRNCHIKFMSADNHIGIVGNGNLDTQSFYHSQEMNLLIDSEQIVSDWMHQLNSNQSTKLYGQVDQKDGIWRNHLTGESLQAPKKISCFTAIAAMI